MLKTRVEHAVDNYITSDEFKEKITNRLEEAIPRLLRERFKENPDAQLTEVGFVWAGALALQDFWPDMSIKQASHDFRDYFTIAKIKFEDPDYDWSASAAQEIAEEIATTI